MIRKKNPPNPKAKTWEPYPVSNNHYFIDFDLFTLFKQKAFFLVFLINKRGSTNNSFAITHKEISQETGLSEYQIKKYKKFFKELGIVQTKMKGIPAKEHYKLKLNKINNYINIFNKGVPNEGSKNE